MKTNQQINEEWVKTLSREMLEREVLTFSRLVYKLNHTIQQQRRDINKLVELLTLITKN